LTFVR